MGIKTILKKIKPLVWCHRELRELVLDNMAKRNFKKERKIKHALVDGKVNVGFVFTQGSYDWGKVEPIFMALLKDSRFVLTVICLPPWIGEDRVKYDETKNENYNFLKNRFSDVFGVRIIDGWLGGDKFIDFKTFDFSYVFFNSPYPKFAPASYQPKIVCRYTKICYTPYGFENDKIFRPICYSWEFFRWLYCCYCTSQDEKGFLDDRLVNAGTQTFQRNAFCGFPRVYGFAKQKNVESPVWDFSKNDFRVIWTPRWSTEDSIGGSNFLKYKDFMLELVKENADIDFVFRPHPLTFGNFIKTGQMTDTEVDEYKSACYNANSRLDETSEYAPTFWKSSVLITDNSSIIAEYFITGKPIIFCTTKTGAFSPTEVFEKILSCCYMANSEDDVNMYLIKLYDGKDSLKEKRLNMIKEVFGDNIDQIPNRICKDLWQDYEKRKR